MVISLCAVFYEISPKKATCLESSLLFSTLKGPLRSPNRHQLLTVPLALGKGPGPSVIFLG